MPRKSTGKRMRFEIFKRDGFKCTYCGATPVQKTLRVDHVDPVANGGKDTPDNLVTACFDCNAGKAAVPLDERKLKVGFAREEDREHAEQIREYLAIQRDIHGAKTEAARELAAVWEQRIGPMSQNMFARLPGLMAEWSHEKLIDAIDITARRLGVDSGADYDARTATDQGKYFSGVLRRWRQEANPQPPPEPKPAPAAALKGSAHQRRAMEAVHRAISDIIASPSEFDSHERTWSHIGVAFARAAWCDEYQLEVAGTGTMTVEDGPFEVRGLALVARAIEGNLTQWSVVDIKNFNPHREAFDDLAIAAQFISGGGIGDPVAQRHLDLFRRREAEIRAWLNCYLEGIGDPKSKGALEHYRTDPDLADIMGRWRLL